MIEKISGWARNNFFKTKIKYPKNILDLQKCIEKKVIARGQGKSYGDSSIQKNCVIGTKNLNRILKFDKKNGIISAESGITIKKIIEKTLKHGWFLPVTPGSKFISLGGMVASDVHGKNHHNVGSFRHHIKELSLMDEKKKFSNAIE